MKQYNKLVRDNIPAIIEADGGVPHTHILNDEEYEAALWEKLDEERLEARENPTIEEFADLQETLDTLAERHGYTPEKIEEAQAKKNQTNGSFAGRIFLESVD